jgi:hypothetical protein
MTEHLQWGANNDWRTVATAKELSGRFAAIDLKDDEALLAWLKEMFAACHDASCEVPDRIAVARAIGAARGLMPNHGVANNPPQGDQTEWLIRESLSALLFAEVPTGRASVYVITALAIEAWLIARREERASAAALRIKALTERWESLVAWDRRAVISWLKEMFEACQQAHVEVPNRRHIVKRLGTAYNVVPNPALSLTPPHNPVEWMAWVLSLSLNALLDSGPARYGIAASAIGEWLAATQESQ